MDVKSKFQEMENGVDTFPRSRKIVYNQIIGKQLFLRFVPGTLASQRVNQELISESEKSGVNFS